MKTICAWCQKNLSGPESPSEPGPISHGLCQECAHHIDAQSGMPLQDFLDGLSAPILVIDATIRILTANQAACQLLSKDLRIIRNHLPGDVSECQNAALPGGCGGTVHCSGCAVRLTVTDTMRTGRSHKEVPAYVNQKDRRLSLRISTEKAGECVLLRIDRLDATDTE